VLDEGAARGRGYDLGMSQQQGVVGPEARTPYLNQFSGGGAATKPIIPRTDQMLLCCLCGEPLKTTAGLVSHFYHRHKIAYKTSTMERLVQASFPEPSL